MLFLLRTVLFIYCSVATGICILKGSYCFELCEGNQPVCHKSESFAAMRDKSKRVFFLLAPAEESEETWSRSDLENREEEDQ